MFGLVPVRKVKVTLFPSDPVYNAVKLAFDPGTNRIGCRIRTIGYTNTSEILRPLLYRGGDLSSHIVQPSNNRAELLSIVSHCPNDGWLIHRAPRGGPDNAKDISGDAVQNKVLWGNNLDI